MCRKCRFEKCLLMGMLPSLVDSCKKFQDHETPSSISGMNSLSTDVILVRNEAFNENMIKEILSEQFYKVYNNCAIGKELYLIS